MRWARVVGLAWMAAPIILMLGESGYRNEATAGGPAHGARAAGMGTAFAAVADDPSAITHNPAGLAFQDGMAFYGGAMLIAPSTTYRDNTGNREKTEDQLFVAPHGYLVSETPSSRLTVGLGLFSPFGVGGRNWSETGELRYVSTESTIATLTANPVIAYRITDNFAIAAGVDYLYSENEMHHQVDQAALQAADGTMRFEGDGGNWGWNVGMLWQIDNAVRIGAAYRSGVKVQVKGEVSFVGIAPALRPLFRGDRADYAASTNIPFPAITTLGVAWKVRPNWTVVLEVEHLDWSSFATQKITFDRQEEPVLLDDVVMELDWHDSWLTKIGMECRLDPRWMLRSGYVFLTSQIPDKSLSPAAPDSDQHNFSLGVGYTAGRYWLDLAYVYALYARRTVDNRIAAGSYDNDSHALMVSLGWSF